MPRRAFRFPSEGAARSRRRGSTRATERLRFSLEVAYPATHRLRGRGYVREEQRRYSLSDQGKELVATLDATHREGIEAHVDGLEPDERRRLDAAFGTAR